MNIKKVTSINGGIYQFTLTQYQATLLEAVLEATSIPAAESAAKNRGYHTPNVGLFAVELYRALRERNGRADDSDVPKVPRDDTPKLRERIKLLEAALRNLAAVADQTGDVLVRYHNDEGGTVVKMAAALALSIAGSQEAEDGHGR